MTLKKNLKFIKSGFSIYGSGIGPTLYIIMKTDLHTLSKTNDTIKHADDTTLLVTV